jgi:RNA polymerase sigma factor (sigma-70 family)
LEIPKDTLSASSEQALKKAYKDNYPWLENYIKKNSGNQEDAQDIFQESLCAAWLNLREGKFKGDSEQFNAYIRQICKFKWINMLKSTAFSRTRSIEDFAHFEGHADSMEELEMQLEQSKRLNESFSDIGDKCKELLGKFYFKRRPLAKIAEAMNTTEESIKTIKYRCMMRLRKIYLEKYYNNE